MIVTLGGITFNDGNLDSNGVDWALDLDGWWGAPELRVEAADLPLRDGTRVGDGYRAARAVNLHGGIVHGDADVTVAALNQLKAGLDIVREDGALVCYESGGPKVLTVRRQSSIEVIWHGSAVEWSTTVVAADFRKYDVNEQAVLLGPYTTPTDGLDLTLDSGADLGIDEATGSGVDLGVDFSGAPGAFPDLEALNAGTADVYPLIEVRGPTTPGDTLTEFTLSNLTTGEDVNVVTDVNQGESLWLDMGAAYGIRSGSPVTLGGVTRYGDWTSPRTPLALVPGVNLLRFVVDAGDSAGATCRVAWRSGWE